MKEHPILFSGEMVRAILEGRKTQTRRVITIRTCRYGIPGWLWVKETWTPEYCEDEPTEPKDGRPIFHYHSADTEFDPDYWLWPHYRATDPTPELCYEDDEDGGDEPKCIWRPSIFMPRWASRINLEIVKIRVERIQEITEEDAIAEGAPLGRILGYGRLGMESHREGFIDLWDEINDKRGFGWLSNPWVWVIEFKKIAHSHNVTNGVENATIP
jgi:hypothetical protein